MRIYAKAHFDHSFNLFDLLKGAWHNISLLYDAKTKRLVFTTKEKRKKEKEEEEPAYPPLYFVVGSSSGGHSRSSISKPQPKKERIAGIIFFLTKHKLNEYCNIPLHLDISLLYFLGCRLVIYTQINREDK